MAPSPSSSLGGRTMPPTSCSSFSAKCESSINYPYLLIDSKVCKRFKGGVWCRAVSVFGIYSSFPNLESLPGILVRDEAARDKLRAMVGDIGIIMSVTFRRISYRVVNRYKGHSVKPKGLNFRTSFSTISSAIHQPRKRIGASFLIK